MHIRSHRNHGKWTLKKDFEKIENVFLKKILKVRGKWGGGVNSADLRNKIESPELLK